MSRKPVLVIGGGISGITAAVELAEAGREVILVEKLPYLGGNVARMNNYFPKLCPPSCGLEINFGRIRQNRRIRVITEASIKELSGTAGNFKANLKREPQYINDYCTACGKCAEVCPVTRLNPFNFGFDEIKAADLPHEMAFPMKYSIDGDYCLKQSCGKCLNVCFFNAINLNASPEEINLDVSSVIVATGWGSYDVSKIKGLANGQSKNIVTNLQFERLLSPSGPWKGKLLRPSDEKPAKEIVFVQCAGSRDQNHLPYCSSVCCSASLKHAITLREVYPDSHATICYIDLRVSGRNEDFLLKAEKNQGIDLVKGKVAWIEEDKETGDLIVEAEDILSGRKRKFRADLVVLAAGIVPEDPGIGITKTREGFAVSGQEPGINVVSCARMPMDVSASVKDATGAVLRALQITS